jgi:two-component system chemotaxis response regulator CheY
VDWNMPQMNGLDFVRHLRADPRNSSVVLMMVTTETEVDQMVKALAAGANEYVMKPFTKDIISDKLRMLGMLQ